MLAAIHQDGARRKQSWASCVENRANCESVIPPVRSRWRHGVRRLDNVVWRSNGFLQPYWVELNDAVATRQDDKTSLDHHGSSGCRIGVREGHSDPIKPTSPLILT